MQHWLSWVIVAIICAVAEIFTEGFFIIWFSGGALAAALGAGLGLALEWQFGVFVVVSAALVLSTKRLVERLHKKDVGIATNVQALIGKDAFVIMEIPERGSGQVKVGGDIWTARSVSGRRIPQGVTVTVTGIDGVHLVVRSPE